MTLLIIEPESGGHRYTYLENVVQGALDRDIQVIIGVGDDSHGSGIRKELTRRFGDQVRHVSAPIRDYSGLPPSAVSIAFAEWHHRRFLREIFRSANRVTPIEQVFLPFVDSSLFAISLLGSPFGRVRFSGITMRQRFHFRDCGVRGGGGRLQPTKERLFRRLLRLPTLEHVFTIDETLLEHFQAKPSPGSEKVIYIPDPSDAPSGVTQAEARQRLGLPASACVLLMYGSVTRRKGLCRLLTWMTGATRDAHLLVVGRQASDVPPLFEVPSVQSFRNEGRLHVFNDFIAAEDESTFFAAADLVWLAYDSFELMSSVLVKAALHGRGVVFFDHGLIARYARRHGREYRPGELPACVSTIGSLPSILHVRVFRRDDADQPLPDHSWSAALRRIYG